MVKCLRTTIENIGLDDLGELGGNNHSMWSMLFI